MLTVRTRVAPSSIHGLGVFADEDVAEGAEIWRFEPGLDLLLPRERLAELPPAGQFFMAMYSYESVDFPDRVVLSGDHARFLNHSDDPNTAIGHLVTLARRPILAGEEITCDYGAFCVGWTGFD